MNFRSFLYLLILLIHIDTRLTLQNWILNFSYAWIVLCFGDRPGLHNFDAVKSITKVCSSWRAWMLALLINGVESFRWSLDLFTVENIDKLNITLVYLAWTLGKNSTRLISHENMCLRHLIEALLRSDHALSYWLLFFEKNRLALEYSDLRHARVRFVESAMNDFLCHLMYDRFFFEWTLTTWICDFKKR